MTLESLPDIENHPLPEKVKDTSEEPLSTMLHLVFSN